VYVKTTTFFLCLILVGMTLESLQVIAQENQVQRKYKIDELIGIALENNPSLSSSISNIDIAKGNLRTARAYPNPVFEISAAKGTSRDDGSTKAEFGITVTQPVEWPLKRLYRGKAAEEEIKVSELEKDAVQAELIFTTKQLFYSILFAKKDLEIAKENLDISRTLLSIIERRVELGESRELDLIKAKVETLKSERELIRAESNLVAVKAILNRFLGGSLEKNFDVEGELRPPSTIFSIDEIGEKVDNFNPQLKAQKIEVKRAEFSILEQKHLVVPDIFLLGFYDKEIDKTDLGGGIGISIPFWYQNQGGIQSAKAEERKATSDLKLLEIETGNRLDDEYKNYKIAFEQSKIFSGELLKEAKRSLEIAEFSYEQGETQLLDVLDALRTYRDTIREYYQVLYKFYVSEITLEKIAGGRM